jgi:hypothetical protein
MLSRRVFLGSLAAAFAIDPERALWVPGAKKLFIPPPHVTYKLSLIKEVRRYRSVGMEFEQDWVIELVDALHLKIGQPLNIAISELRRTDCAFPFSSPG